MGPPLQKPAKVSQPTPTPETPSSYQPATVAVSTFTAVTPTTQQTQQAGLAPTPVTPLEPQNYEAIVGDDDAGQDSCEESEGFSV